MLRNMLTLCLLAQPLQTPNTCFLINNANNHIVYAQGDNPHERITPCSTFKIVLSLIGFNSGILVDQSTPEWPYTEYPTDFQSWKTPQTPTTWINRSVIWYSQKLTKRLGINTLQNYLEQFDYGNQDLSGDPGQHNGLTNAWLSSSLKISPFEQIEFLQKLTHEELPVSKHAHTMTKKLLYIKELSNGWKLYGKTGGGYEPQGKLCWLIGWIEKNDNIVLYAYIQRKNTQNPTKEQIYACVESLLYKNMPQISL